jgi:hypothetical protein
MHQGVLTAAKWRGTRPMKPVFLRILYSLLLQSLESFKCSLCRALCTLWICACHEPPVDNMEVIPDAGGSNVCTIYSQRTLPFTSTPGAQIPKKTNSEVWQGDMDVHLAPNFSAHSSIRGSFQLRMVSIRCISYSPSVVKPVMVFPTIIDLPVAWSITPGKSASPWQLDRAR